MREVFKTTEMTFSPIEGRFVPPVAGVDLEQALNYVTGPPIEWFYTSYSYPKVFYRSGSRPELEQFLCQRKVAQDCSVQSVQHLVNAVHETTTHYSILGAAGEANLGLKEEEILVRGRGWCNEQARVLAALAQVSGLPSRLVFAAMPDKRGHVLTEIFADRKWILVDQSAGFVFTDSLLTPMNVFDLVQETDAAIETGRLYRKRLQEERLKSRDQKFWDKYVSYGVLENPLLLFHSVGYCNYFIH